MGLISKIRTALAKRRNNSTKRRLEQVKFHESKLMMDYCLLHCQESGVATDKYCDHNVIISLTTYGRRIHSVYLTIESLMQQTMKANKIVLWLDNSFQGKRLPESLNMLKKRGLEILYCKDIRSYQKLVPALRQFPDDAIITVDDDIIYNANMLENLITAYIEDPTNIYCNRAHRMKLKSDGSLKLYKHWGKRTSEVGPNVLNFLTGVGGVLYPPHSLDDEVLNEEVFMDICKMADDVWFAAMALKKGTPVYRVATYDPHGDEFIEDATVQDTSLSQINCSGEVLNNVQIARVFEKYGLYEKLKG